MQAACHQPCTSPSKFLITAANIGALTAYERRAAPHAFQSKRLQYDLSSIHCGRLPRDGLTRSSAANS